MKTLPFILLALAMLALAACNGTTIAMGAAGAGPYLTRPQAPPPDVADAIPPHESWCYETLGYPECYAHPLNDDPNRLINVDPASRYPLTLHDYNEARVNSEN